MKYGFGSWKYTPPPASDCLEKYRLENRIEDRIHSLGLSWRAAADRMDISYERLERILKGEFEDVSIKELKMYINRLNKRRGSI